MNDKTIKMTKHGLNATFIYALEGNLFVTGSNRYGQLGKNFK